MSEDSEYEENKDDAWAGARMRPVLAKDIRSLSQLTIEASDPDSQASALPPVLEPQQKTLLDKEGPGKGCRRV